MPLKSFVLAAAVYPLPATAAAHPGGHDRLGALAGLRHLATQPDHLLALSALLLGLLTCGGLQLVRVRARARAQARARR